MLGGPLGALTAWTPTQRTLVPRHFGRTLIRARPVSLSAARPNDGLIDVLPSEALAELPQKFVLFTDLHVQRSTLPVCLRVLRKVAEEAEARSAGVICLGDFWHAGGILHTRQLNAVLSELNTWGDHTPMIMIPGNHDQSMRGDPSPLLHALTPLGQAAGSARVRVFSRPTLLGDSLWVPYGTSDDQLRNACDAAAQTLAHSGHEDGLAAVFCHADIVGGLMNDGVAATVGLPPDAFPPLPTRVYSGHYHKPHVVAEPMARGRHIRYAGSPYQTSMAEAGQRKALLVLDRTAGWALEEEIPLDVGPRHHVVRTPSDTELNELRGGLRAGDRVLVLSSDADDASLRDFANEQRKAAVSVEVRAPPEQLLASSQAATAALGENGTALPGQIDLQRPAALFDAYATARNLSAAMVAAGKEVLEASLGNATAAEQPPVRLSLSTVELEGFGSFANRVEYPLDARGLLLLRGSRLDAASAAASMHGHVNEQSAFDAALGAAEGDADGDISFSNGAGKTTLAMAPLWALTGSTDARADGKPIEARGVINDGCTRARVTLRGVVEGCAMGGSNVADGLVAASVPVPFEVVRAMGKREHTLSFTVGGVTHNGTLAQVQQQLDAALRAPQVGRVAFFGQHDSGGLLSKSDAQLKSDLQELLPLEVWESARELARQQALRARDTGERASGELEAVARDVGDAATHREAVENQLQLWEVEREGRVSARRAELGELMEAAGEHVGEGRHGEVGEGGGVSAWAAAEAAHVAAQSALVQRREELTAQLAVAQSGARAARSALHAQSEAVMEAEATAADAAARLGKVRQSIASLKATVSGWAWGAKRLRAAKAMADRDAADRQRLLARVANDAARVAAVDGGASGVGDDAARMSAAVAAALERQARQLRTTAIASRQRAEEVSSPPVPSKAAGDGEDVGVCGSCGQPISSQHLCAQRDRLEAAAAVAEAAAAEREESAQIALDVADGERLAGVMTQMRTVSSEEVQAARAVEAADEARKAQREALSEQQRTARALETSRETAETRSQEELTKLATEEHAAASALAAAAKAKAATERREALATIQIDHATKAHKDALDEANPHTLRARDATAQVNKLRARQKALEATSVEAAARQETLSGLLEHFGKRGVQNLLYTLALRNLEASAGVYAAELSDGRLQLRLTFDDNLKAIRKFVRVRRADGSLVDRSISQVCDLPKSPRP